MMDIIKLTFDKEPLVDTEKLLVKTIHYITSIKTILNALK